MFDFSAVFTGSGLIQLSQIVIGDLTMAGDNVVIMGALAAGLPEKDRKRVLMLGVGIALIFLILFAVIATQLLKVTGLVFGGGLLLLWVGYNMFRELGQRRREADTAQVDALQPGRSFARAVISITLADLSMSLDNVLLVASIARQNPALLFFGLGLSVLLMGVAANYVARLIQRFHWVGWIGLAVIFYVACNMIYEGWIGGDHVLGLRTLLHL